MPVASVAVLANATNSESLIATPLHTEGDPVPGSRILQEGWTSPASPLRLTIHHHSRDDPPLGGHRRLGEPSRLRRSASPHEEPLRLLIGATPHEEPLLLLIGATPHGGPLRLLIGTTPHGGPLRLLIGANASRRTPSPVQRRVASRPTPSPTQRRVASKRSPPPKRVAGAPGAGTSSDKRPLSRDSRSPKRSSRESLSQKRGSPPAKRQRYEARDSVSPSTSPLIKSLFSRVLTGETPFAVFSYSSCLSFERREGG